MIPALYFLAVFAHISNYSKFDGINFVPPN